MEPDEPLRLRRMGEALVVGVRASPSARRTRVQGRYGDRLKVQLSAPPEDDRANGELVDALTGWLGLPSGSVCIRSGRRSRDKQVAITGVSEPRLRGLLEGLLGLSSSDQERDGHG